MTKKVELPEPAYLAVAFPVSPLKASAKSGWAISDIKAYSADQMRQFREEGIKETFALVIEKLNKIKKEKIEAGDTWGKSTIEHAIFNEEAMTISGLISVVENITQSQAKGE